MFDSLKSLGRLGVGVLSAVLLLLAVVVMSATRAFNAGMIAIKPEFFLHLAATVIAVIATWRLLAGDSVVARRLGAMALVAFLLANVPLKLPGTWKLGTAAISETDKANARSAEALEVAKVVAAVSPLFTREGIPRYFWSPGDEPPVFYDRAGIHPDRGIALRPVDDEIFAMIRRRQAEAAKVPEAPVQAVVVVPPSPAPAPTPSPEPVAAPVAQASPQAVTAPDQKPILIRAKPWRPKYQP